MASGTSIFAALMAGASKFVAFALASIPLTAVATHDRHGEGPRLPGRVEEVLRWLPEDTKSLMVARGPFEVNASILPDETDRWVDIEGLFRAPALWPYSDLAREHPGLFHGRPVELAVAGCRNFRELDADLWGVEGGFVAFFRDDAGPIARDLIGEEAEEADQPEHAIGEVEVRGLRLLLAQPRPHVLVIATDRAFLETMLRRMADRSARRALPPELPEWQYVDPEAQGWGIRHAGAGGIFLDRPAEGIPESDPEAIGTTYAYDPAAGVAKFAYLSGGGHAAAIAEAFWTPKDEMPFPQTTRAAAPDAAVTRLAIAGRIDNDPVNRGFLLNSHIRLSLWCGIIAAP